MTNRCAALVSATLILCGWQVAEATTLDAEALAGARALAQEMQQAEFSESRCLLAPLLANDKRTVTSSLASAFHEHDLIEAVNGERLNPFDGRALHHLLVRHPPDSQVTVQVRRGRAAAINVHARCLDSLALYAPLRAAATAALIDNIKGCSYWIATAQKTHALGSTWLRLALHCDRASGQVSDAALLAQSFAVSQAILLENSYSLQALSSVSSTLAADSQMLEQSGGVTFATKLRSEQASATQWLSSASSRSKQ